MSDTGRLDIVVWSVEHGSAAYAKTPNGRHIILDAGSSSQFSPAKWLNEKYNVDGADLFVLSHAHADHISDIRNVDEMLKPITFLRNKTVPAGKIYDPFPPVNDPHKHYWNFDQRFSGNPPAGYSFEPESNWGGVTIQAFRNDAGVKDFANLNDYSLATVLLFGNLEILFPGDLEAPGWEALMESPKAQRLFTPSSTNQDEIRILVAAHHGRSAGVHIPFLERYRPHLTLMSEKRGSEHTDYSTYSRYTGGYFVRNPENGQFTERKVVTTKTNEYVLVVANSSAVLVQAG